LILTPVIDFDPFIKNKLLSFFHEVENTQVPVVQDDYLVKINLKDDYLCLCTMEICLDRTYSDERDH